MSLSSGPPQPSGPPPAAPRVHLGFFIASGVFLVLAVIVLLLIAVAIASAETDSERQAAGFFLTAAVPFCGLAVVFLVVGLIVAAVGRQRQG